MIRFPASINREPSETDIILGLDKTDAIFQTTFANAFVWKKLVVV